MGQHHMWNTKNGNYGFTIIITEIQTFEREGYKCVCEILHSATVTETQTCAVAG